MSQGKEYSDHEPALSIQVVGRAVRFTCGHIIDGRTVAAMNVDVTDIDQIEGMAKGLSEIVQKLREDKP